MKNILSLTVAAFGLTTFNVSAATLYVSLESSNPVPPFATWATAASNIQHAVDVARAGDTVLVTNGVYAVGSRGTAEYPEYNLSRVMVTNAIRLESVNGPLATTIDGGGSMRCVYLGVNAVLSGFTLTSGVVRGGRGGGVFSEPSGVVTNCVITGNHAGLSPVFPGWGGGAYGGNLYNCTLTHNGAGRSMEYYGGHGGGAYESTLYNCTLTGNSGSSSGGGATGSTLYNCTLTGNNSGHSGGGAYGSTLYNCTLTGNSANYGGGAWGCTLYNCTVVGNLASDYEGGAGGATGSTLYNCTVTGNDGVGATSSTLYNCTVTENDGGGVGDSWMGSSTVFNSIVYYNFGGNYAEGTVLNFSCTSPLPTNGVGNITGPPLFMDLGAGDYRLWEGSPCIDAGANLIALNVGYTYEPTDILGNTRFIDGNFDGRVAWDMGAYEFNSFRPPQFTCAPQRMPDCWRLSITGAPNKWVRLQRSSDLKNWEDFLWPPYILMGAEGVKQVDDRLRDGEEPQAMFYRVVVE